MEEFKQGLAFTTVDPKYRPYWFLYPLLSKLKVVKMRKHSFSHMMTLLSGHHTHKPKPHWIQLAVVSLSMEYLDIVPYNERDGSEFN